VKLEDIFCPVHVANREARLLSAPDVLSSGFAHRIPKLSLARRELQEEVKMRFPAETARTRDFLQRRIGHDWSNLGEDGCPQGEPSMLLEKRPDRSEVALGTCLD